MFCFPGTELLAERVLSLRRGHGGVRRKRRPSGAVRDHELPEEVQRDFRLRSRGQLERQESNVVTNGESPVRT